MDLTLFDHVGELTRSLVGTTHGPVRHRSHRRGVKVWFGDETPDRFHYEAQVIPRRYVDDEPGTAIEIGFHAEHPDEARNAAVLERLESVEKIWRKTLGPAAEAGAFLGNAPDWRRVSETWLDVDVVDDDAELAFEVASTLVDYITALQPTVSAGDAVTRSSTRRPAPTR